MPRYSYTPTSLQGAKRQLIYGLVLVAIGVVITVGTYTWASQGGGTYFISFGPIIIGAIRIFTAVPVLLRSRGQPQGLSGWAPNRPGPPPGPGSSWRPGQPGVGTGAPWGQTAPPAPAAWGSAPSAPAGAPTAFSSGPAMATADPASATADPASAPIAGWYSDPSGAAQLRWWDGSTWTEQTRPGG